MYLNSEKEQTKSQYFKWREKNKFIYNNVIKVIQNKDIKTDFLTFFTKTINEIFYVKKVVDNVLSKNKNETLHVVDIEHFSFNKQNGVVFYFMEEFEFTLFDFIEHQPLKASKGGTLFYDNDDEKHFMDILRSEKNLSLIHI